MTDEEKIEAIRRWFTNRDCNVVLSNEGAYDIFDIEPEVLVELVDQRFMDSVIE
jgi:hypothetical protein